MKRRWLIIALAAAALQARAANGDWRTAWDAALYAYPEHRWLEDNSVVNPDNRLAGLPETTYAGEARINLRLANDRYRLTARPILFINKAVDGETEQHGYLSQWQARAALTPYTALSIGREVMNWGPSQFRSPASPFYFDNGRSDPLRELSGVDAAKLTWTPDRSHTLTFAYIEDSGHDPGQPDPWEHTWLLKGDLRGDNWTGGMALAQAQGRAPFVGLHLRYTVSDAWMLYGELASATRANALLSPTDAAQPFDLVEESRRRQTGLLGATYTFENGHSLTLEYLHDGHGYSRDGSRAYFARAAANPMMAALALANAPPLLNRNYLHLVWQNNLLEGDNYWRLMLSRNLDDGSSQLAAYGEHALSGRLTLFLLGVHNTGGARREFGMLIGQSLSLGVRLALP